LSKLISISFYIWWILRNYTSEFWTTLMKAAPSVLRCLHSLLIWLFPMFTLILQKWFCALRCEMLSSFIFLCYPWMYKKIRKCSP
jgi:uncharacterized protein involved in cysteine biosynthesis